MYVLCPLSSGTVSRGAWHGCPLTHALCPSALKLFDFDLEVRPILEVLVGKTLEQALMEVMEEEELQRLRDHQEEFYELRQAELLEVSESVCVLGNLAQGHTV